MNASVPPISTTTGGEDGRKTADILSATRRVVSARHGISLREKAAELLKIQAPKSILKRAIDKETTFNAADTALSAIGLIGGEPPTKKMRRTGLSWVDDVKGTALHSVVEFPLDPGQTIRSTCADDKARRSQIAAIRRRPAAQLLEYQGKFFFENRMNQFKVKTNIFKWSLSPADFQKLAEKRGIDASTCEKKYVTSEELEIQNARMKYAEEAIYIEQGMIPQDPHPFKDKKERIVYTSHTNAKSRAIINIEDCGAESSSASSIIETMIYPADIAAGANDRMTYEFVEEKRPTKVMTYHVNDADYVDMDDVTPSVDGNSSVVVEQGVSLPSEEDITAGEVDLDGISVAVGAGLADSEENQSDIDLDEVDAKGLVALHNLGPEVLNFLINNEDKFNELCIDGVIDEEKTGVLTETVAEFREATNCGDKVFDDIDLNMIFDLAQRKLHRKIESDNFSSSNMEIRSRNAAVDDLKVKILKLIKSKRSIALSQLVLYYKDMYGERFDYPGKLQVFLKSLLEGCQEVSFFGTQIIYTKNSRRNSVENWKNSSSSNVISGGRYNCGASPADSIRNRNPEIQAEKKKDFISSANNNAVCKYYNHNGGCQFGMNCRYLHIS